MNSTELTPTKESILKVAVELFARFGYEGTSIRKIASEASVNVAAINYHFKDKESLYWEVLKRNYNWLDEGVRSLDTEKTLTLEEFCMKLMEYFMQHHFELMSSFKILLTDSETLSFNDGGFSISGPPGADILAWYISREAKKEITPLKRQWAVRMIFSSIVHFGVVMGTSFMKANKNDDRLTCNQISNDIKDLTKAIMAHLNS